MKRPIFVNFGLIYEHKKHICTNKKSAMLFNSLKFLLFFPIVGILYWLLPHRLRNAMLLIASYFFYMNWEPVYALLIMFSTVTTWGASLLIDNERDNPNRRKWWLAGCITVNIGILFVFKYFNFITESVFNLLSMTGLRLEVPHFALLLPVGISFYTFQAIGYIIDVTKGTVKPTRNLARYALFVSFFPQLVAGPIERSTNLLPQFDHPHRFNAVEVIEGLKLMMLGYFMKLCIADNVSGYVDAVYNNLPYHNGMSVLLASFFFTFQIFCDFGGYSLIAIGTAKCMGFTLMQNFKQPYLATSFKDFWRRWHVSLTSWFTDYVYIPLGGNRCSKKRHAANTIGTMLISGLWHGANWTFVVWGGAHGALLVANNVKRRIGWLNFKETWLTRIINIAFVFLLVMAGWVFFRANTLSDALLAFKKMFTEPGMLYKGEGVPSILLGLLLIGCLMLREMWVEYKWRIPFISGKSMTRDIAYTVSLVIAILLCGQFNGGQFIYFQF